MFSIGDARNAGIDKMCDCAHGVNVLGLKLQPVRATRIQNECEKDFPEPGLGSQHLGPGAPFLYDGT